MFGRRKRIKSSGAPDSIIGRQAEISGNLNFSGDLVILGTVFGNVVATDDSSSVLNLSETGRVEGEIRVPNVAVNGVVVGDVYATERVQLAENARISGNVYYHLIEIEMGAEVNGSLVHMEDKHDSRLTLGHEPPVASSLTDGAPTTLQLEQAGAALTEADDEESSEPVKGNAQT
jgi:cytoskeletal protein CcmA (bactofilin family)